MVLTLVFYFLAGILLLSGFCVITARNPVHSVLFLILAFFNSAGLFILLGAEFIAMLMVIVYVGAVAVLFLFVVMMLDVNFAELREGAMQYVPIGLLIGGVLLAEFVMLYGAWEFAPEFKERLMSPATDKVTNTEALGQILYTEYVYAFQLAGLILLVAMIGAIVLTHRTRPGVRKQKIADQHKRQPEDVLEIKKITPGTGI